MPFFRSPFESYDLAATHAETGSLQLSVRPTRIADAAEWTRSWRPGLRGTPPADWPWVEHIVRGGVEPERLCIAISRSFQGDALEALLSLSVAESSLAPGSRLVYIEYVGKHPAAGTISPRLGMVLVFEAMRISYRNGYDGRVGLHSKGGKLDGWYKKLGFQHLFDDDTADGRFLYCECTAEIGTAQANKLE